MSDSAFEPPTEPAPATRPGPWRRILGLALDVLIVLVVLESWDLAVVDVSGLLDGGPPVIGATPTGPRGFALSGRGGQVIGLGVTGIALALQVPFAWRRSTLGLALFGLQIRADGRRAPPYLSLPWSLGAWALTVAALAATVVVIATVTQPDPVASLLGGGLLVMAAASVNLGVAVQTGRSLLDRMLGVEIVFAATTEATEATDHTTGWQPRPDFKARRPAKIDEDVHAWRTHSSADPLAPIWGPDPGPMLESPEDPAHVDHVADDDPFAAVGSQVDTSDETALAARLRSALGQTDDEA